jgi:hypothetical protein
VGPYSSSNKKMIRISQQWIFFLYLGISIIV